MQRVLASSGAIHGHMFDARKSNSIRAGCLTGGALRPSPRLLADALRSSAVFLVPARLDANCSNFLDCRFVC